TSYISEESFQIRYNAWLDYVLFLKNKLSSLDYELLNISAISQLIKVLKNKLGIKNILFVLKKCKENDITLLDKRLFNPLFIIKALKNNRNSSRDLKKTEIRT